MGSIYINTPIAYQSKRMSPGKALPQLSLNTIFTWKNNWHIIVIQTWEYGIFLKTNEFIALIADMFTAHDKIWAFKEKKKTKNKQNFGKHVSATESFPILKKGFPDDIGGNINKFIYLFIFVFLGPHPWHTELPRLREVSEL